MKKKNYCLIGSGSRGYMYIDALFGKYSEYGKLAGICDSNYKRMEIANSHIKDTYKASKTLSKQYTEEELEKLCEEQ